MKSAFKLIFILFFVLAWNRVQAQNSIASAGGNGTGTTGSISYTTGQVVYSEYSGTTGSVTEGVQQPFEISVPTGSEYTDFTLELSVYPNPVSDLLMLKTGDLCCQGLQYGLSDIAGRIISVEPINSEETSVSFSDLKAGIYFLKISLNGKEIKVFKIIKN